MNPTKKPRTKNQQQITVIIPTLNNNKGLKYLLDCFNKLNYPLVIIDNQPTEEKRLLCTNKPIIQSSNKLLYLPQSINLGFASSINRGAKLVKTDWLLILNDDIEFPTSTVIPNLFRDLIRCAEINRWVTVSPVLKNEKDEIENYGYRVLPYGRIELIKQCNNSTIEQSNLDGLTAACLLIKTDIFKKLNGFDESFFAYLEDVDLFLRIKEYYNQKLATNNQPPITNHQSLFGICPDSEVVHHHLTTSKTMGNFKQKQDFINWIRLIIKHPKTFFTPSEVPQGGTKWGNFINFTNLIVERTRNLSGLIKSYIK